MKTPTPAEQVESLRIGNFEQIVKNFLGIDLLKDQIKNRTEILKKVIFVSRADIKKYLKDKYDIHELIPLRPQEGLFAEREGLGFKVYEQDYGRICGTRFVNNVDELLDEYVKFIIDRSCTGLIFD